MSNGPDEFIASVYGTGVDYEEKVAAEQGAQEEALAGEVMELEKAAAVEAFTDAMIEEGLDPQQFTDEQIEAGFNQFYEDMSKTAAEEPMTEEQGEEMVKQAWAEADAVGRQIAQSEFIEMVKAAAGESAAEKAFGKGATGKVSPEYKGVETKAVEAPRRYFKRAVGTEKGLGAAQTVGEKGVGSVAKKTVPALEAVIKKHPKAALGLAAGVGAAELGAAGYGAYRAGKHLKGKQKAASLQTPFLDDAIEKCAMAILLTSGAMTPDGEGNMTKEGQYLQEPTWVEEYEFQEPKTALDQAVFNAALAHLEELGYPVNWGEE